jgi:PAS domain S-box-containing protein
MKLGHRAVLFAGVTLLLLVLTILVFTVPVLMRGFNGLESDFVLLNVERVQRALAMEIDRLHVTAGDWAGWDESVALVKSGSPGFVERNLKDETFDNLGVNLIAFIDNAGRVVHAAGFDSWKHSSRPVAQDEIAGLTNSVLLRPSRRGKGRQGLVRLGSRLCMVAARPIVGNDFKGPSQGVVVFGRDLEPFMASYGRIVTRWPVHLMTVDTPEVPPGLGHGAQVVSRDWSRVSGYFRLNDVAGRPTAVIRIDTDRRIANQGLLTLHWLAIWLVGVSFACCLLVLIVLRRFVLQRLSELGSRVDVIRRNPGGAENIRVEGNDEITRLGEAVNAMLQAVRHAHAERLTAERRLSFSEERYRALYAGITDAVLVYHLAENGAPGRLIEVNDEACRRLGYTREELLSMTMAGIDAPESGVNARPFAAAVQGGRSVTFEQVHQAKNGRRIPVEIHAQGFTLDGEPAVIALARDISDRKRVEAERREFETRLQQTQKLESLGVLAGGIAHDFNNILMTILGNADLALQDMPENAPTRANLEDIGQASRRAADLCRQMLAYSGRGQLTLRPIDLSEVVDDTMHMLKVSVSKKAVLRCHIDRSLPAVEADVTQIRQIIMNLVINASESIGDRSGVIAVTTGAVECDSATLAATWFGEPLPGGLYVYVEVADTGCGIAPDQLPLIFDPFYTTKFTGRGLGLSAVLGIVRSHHGALVVNSEPGKGTTFRVLFPAATGPAHAVRDRRPLAEGWTGSGTVLVVDDEDTVRTLGKRMLERSGFTVLTAADGREAVELFKVRGADICCVILDLTMPHMDGAETFRAMRALRPDIKVILSSGYTEQDVSERFAGITMAGFIQKPYQQGTLTSKLREVLSGEETPV